MVEWEVQRMDCMHGKRTVLIFVILVCLMIPGLGCQKKAEKVTAQKVVNVKVWTTATQNIRPFVETVGSLKPNEEVIISPEVDGILKTVRVDEGSIVRQGEVLAEVKATDYRLASEQAQSAFKQAEAVLANTRLEYQRKEALFKEELVTKQQFDDVSTRLTIAASDLDRAKAGAALARERLDKTVIRSPLNGVVQQRMVAPGDFVRTSMPILAVIQNDPLKLAFTISEKDIAAVKPGQDIAFTVDSFPGKTFSGALSIVAPSLDERSRMLQVEALVPNPDRQLKPGQFARVKIFTSPPRDAVVVPATSILYEGTRIRVFTLAGTTAHERPLKVGGKYGDMVEVMDGVKAGEQLVVVGQNQLVDGAKVNVVR